MENSTRKVLGGNGMGRRGVSFCKVGVGTFGAVQQSIAELARLNYVGNLTESAFVDRCFQLR